jgi:hypothetical protein
MVAIKLPDNGNEPLISAPVALAELPAAGETKKLSDPVGGLKKSKKIQEAIEIMEALVVDKRLKINERGDYESVDPKDKEAKGAAEFFVIIKRRAKAEEQEKSTTDHAEKSRTEIKKTMSAPRPEKAKVVQAPELPLIDSSEYHKLGLLAEENNPLPESRLMAAAKLINDPEKQNATIEALGGLLIEQGDLLAESIKKQVEEIKAVHAKSRLIEITNDLVRKGWLVRRAYDVIANPNFNPTQGLENAIRAKEDEIEAFLNMYNEIVDDPNGLEIKIAKTRRVGKETREVVDRYAVRFIFGNGGKSVRIGKIVKFNPNSQNLGTDDLYTPNKRPPAWLKGYVELENGQFSLKKPVPQAPKREEPKADKPAQQAQPKPVAKPVEDKKPNPIQEREQALSKLIKDNLGTNPELKLITSVMHAVSAKRPIPSRPSASLEQLAEILKNAFAKVLKRENFAPKSLNELAKAGIEPNLGSLTEIAKAMESEIGKFPLVERPAAANDTPTAGAKPAEEKVA